jgi:Uma2 family endonuclease
MATQEKLFTVDDLWELSHDGSARRRELVKGTLIEMAPAGGLHGIIAMRLGRYLSAYVDEHDLGYVTAAETGYILTENPLTVRAPDVGFIAKSRMPSPIPPRYIPLAPDLVVEVVSPGDTAKEIQDKALDYLRAGTSLIWVVYPESQTANSFSPTGTMQLIEGEGTLDGGEVLPGFRLALHDVFKDIH